MATSTKIPLWRQSSVRAQVRLGLSLAAIVGGFIVASWFDAALAHRMLEIFTVLVAVTVAGVAWHSPAAHPFLRSVGRAYLFAAGLYGMHVMAYWDFQVVGVPARQQSMAMWLTARVVEASILLCAPAVIPRSAHRARRLFLPLVALITVGTYAGVVFDWVPAAVVDGQIAPGARITGWVIAGALLLANVHFQLCARALDRQLIPALSLALAVSLLAEVLFALHPTISGDGVAWGDLCKLASHWLIYRALVQGTLR